ncbi:hypothetical protein SDC9_04011 [bioreactor metagenome]|uniref:Uncharacterized protein n=1 Tax=bioreactor metagenome TaxID=1076179 RepID=A0A644SUW1_9ZZZZ|nr:hypothetical protein [Negativicutes bacterium]
MNVKSGLEIVRLHHEYNARINELEEAATKLGGYGYTQALLEEQMTKLRADLTLLEDTRFQALAPVIVVTSSLGAAAREVPD